MPATATLLPFADRTSKGRQRHWNTTTAHITEPDQIPAFERKLAEFGISLDFAATDSRMRAWVRRHYNRLYVPEAALEALGISYTDWSPWDAKIAQPGRHFNPVNAVRD